MNSNSQRITFFAILIVIALTVYTAVSGFAIGALEVKPISERIKLGLDIEGGVAIVYEAKTDLTGEALSAAINQSIGILSKRVDSLGLTEPKISRQGENQIRIEMPGVTDATEAIESIGKTAKLEFVLVDKNSIAQEGMTGEEFVHTPILTGAQVKDSTVATDEYNNPAVGLEFNSEGTKLFREATAIAKNLDPVVGGQIAILLDNEVISAPYTRVEIIDGNAIITGRFSFEEASLLASLIRGGALPIELEEVRTSIIGATLGIGALNSGVTAAAIGFAIVVVFMSLYYRYPGVIASLALALYASLVLFILVGLKATLTLPGIAGIVLSVGMAVDANVIIFERVKEEVRNGKSLRAAISSGFHRAIHTIVDANVTTFIAAVILYYFGSGPVQGFAVTLMIGIVTSMFTAIVVTRVLIRSSLSFKFANNTKLYGV
ncbi:protein translocase subunit SecD [Acidaminobacter hydrogenoformans]|uniref:Protein translocase subunit SecD n=1 Tax=Acidaminobacter hydrogenoformans DSM 2784 TaxID=1120920 RepID=A0A1G5RY29_9FIRM|nr:protein translocase subunit SecD [Acidaminobacter hydrogenoformans]SCZ78361.1 preprotein translocase subunit SecD [Acidaminobacter hydrogenoformans DSM 2784]